jgi:brefeldin A-inhibited guanine nucleotide-exchange protein
LLQSTGRSLQVESWKEATDMIKQLFEGSMPEMLLKFSDFEISSSSGQLPFSKDEVVTQCVVQLLLIDMLQDTVSQHYENIPPQGIMELLDALQRSFEFAQEFNQKIELRQALKRLGFMREMKQLPGLLKQEREALSCSLKILFQVQRDERMLDSEYATPALERLMKLCRMVLGNYVAKERQVQENSDSQDMSGEAKDREAATVEMEREVMGLVPIISEVVLRGLKELEPQHSARFASELFPLLCELTVVSSREVRLMVREVMLEQVGPLVGAPVPQPTTEEVAKEGSEA